MKASAREIERALDAADPRYRLFLLHGADDPGSRALAARLERAMGADADRVDLDGAQLKADPARLADEAASISLFGGKSWVRVTLVAADDGLKAIEALLDAPAAGNPVVVIAPLLRANSVLLTRLTGEPGALVFASRAPTGEDAERLASAMASAAGLKLAPGLGRRLAEAASGDRAILQCEIEKYALYLDAAPERPAALRENLVELLGADAQDGDFSKMAGAVMGGDPEAAAGEIARLGSEGIAGIPLLRAAAKRSLGMADGGMTSGSTRWTPRRLATAMARLLEGERAVKAPGAIGTIAADHELIAVARAGKAR